VSPQSWRATVRLLLPPPGASSLVGEHAFFRQLLSVYHS
jgi:hypothetical protein